MLRQTVTKMTTSAKAPRAVILVFTLAVMNIAGCGNFPLASSVVPLTSKTQQQQQLDNLGCKDEAKLAANTAGRQTGSFLLGMTLVGAPVAFELEKAKQREVYKSCMAAKGYRVTAPNDQAPVNSASVPPTPARSPDLAARATAARVDQQVAPSGAPSKRDEAAQLQKLNELLDRGLITQAEYERKRKEVLDLM